MHVGKFRTPEQAKALQTKFKQNTNANRMRDRLRIASGLPKGVQNTAANRFDFRSRAMTGLPSDVQNTNENRMRARLARQREQQQMLQNNAVTFSPFNPNFSRDASAAGANAMRAGNNGAGNDDPNIELRKQTALLSDIKVDLANANQTL